LAVAFSSGNLSFLHSIIARKDSWLGVKSHQFYTILSVPCERENLKEEHPKRLACWPGKLPINPPPEGHRHKFVRSVVPP
jgi:hypothetical protein